MLRIHNVKVKLGEKRYAKVISQYLNVREKEIRNVTLVKQSIDARRQNVHFICSFDFQVRDEVQYLRKFPQLQRVQPYQYHYLPSNDRSVMIVGSGPAGLFCAYVLAMSGQKVTVIERGQEIEKREKAVADLLENGCLHCESNIAFGEGGAGTFSDGKLTTGIKNERIRYVLETFVQFGAPEDILYLHKPHIGTDYLRQVIQNMRQFLIEKGVTFLFETQMIDFKQESDSYHVTVLHHGQTEVMNTDLLVLAIGHSARDTYELLYQKGMTLEQKAFAVGVRIEQSQQKINQIQYKKSASSPYLKAAAYKLAVQSGKRGVYTFCMCPGGYVVPSQHEDGTLCVNGMSYYARDGQNANSAILVTVSTDDFGSSHPLAGIEFQRQLEKKAFMLGGGHFHAPVQKAMDYINNEVNPLGKIKPTYQPGYQLCDLNQIFPDFINHSLKEGLLLMNQKMPGFIDEDTILTGVESRSSAPVRILRNENFQSSMKGIYPIGEGAGYAGGIMSSAIDGMMCAEQILKTYK